MFGFSVLSHYFKNLRQSRQHRPLASLTVDELNEIQRKSENGMAYSQYSLPYEIPQRKEALDSPVETCSSYSSGGLSSGFPSPTSHYQRLKDGTCNFGKIEDEKALIREHKYFVDNVRFVEFTMDDQEVIYFLHRELRPIKTKIEPKEQVPYKPLLRTLIQQSKAKHGSLPDSKKSLSDYTLQAVAQPDLSKQTLQTRAVPQSIIA